jgi:hypothetical protein
MKSGLLRLLFVPLKPIHIVFTSPTEKKCISRAGSRALLQIKEMLEPADINLEPAKSDDGRSQGGRTTSAVSVLVHTSLPHHNCSRCIFAVVR